MEVDPATASQKTSIEARRTTSVRPAAGRRSSPNRINISTQATSLRC